MKSLSPYNFRVPVELCQYSITNKFTSPFQLYVYLKGICSGKVKISPNDLLRASCDLDCTVKTVRNNLKKLLKKNWVGFNPKSKYYFIRSFDKIQQIEGLKARTGVEFSEKYFSNFKQFAAGAFIGYLANSIRRNRAIERNKRGSNHIARNSGYFPVSNSLIAKLLHISISTAHKLKKQAFNIGFIDLRKTFQHTGVESYDKKFYKKAMPEVAGRLRIKKDQLMLTDCDLIKPLLSFKRREKNRRINKRVPKGDYRNGFFELKTC